MKLLIILSAFAVLSSCGVAHHTKHIKKHTQKLLNKGVVIYKDTTSTIKRDTLIKIETINDTVFKTETIFETITLEPELIVKTKYIVKQEEKTKRTEIKQTNKTERLVHKQNTQIEGRKLKAESRRSNWYWWMIAGFIIGLYFRRIINKLRTYIIKK